MCPERSIADLAKSYQPVYSGSYKHCLYAFFSSSDKRLNVLLMLILN